MASLMLRYQAGGAARLREWPNPFVVWNQRQHNPDFGTADAEDAIVDEGLEILEQALAA